MQQDVFKTTTILPSMAVSVAISAIEVARLTLAVVAL